ncbi:unnamed protein product [Urochloa humidicola]
MILFQIIFKCLSEASIWAFHGDKESGAGRGKYEIVVFLSGYSGQYGAKLRLSGEGGRFQEHLHMLGCRCSCCALPQKGDLGLLSHHIPARKVSKDEGSVLPPGDCWELDPASLPPELLHLEPQK